MQRISFILFLLMTQVGIAQITTNDPNLKLWYRKPATIWEEAILPIQVGMIAIAKEEK